MRRKLNKALTEDKESIVKEIQSLKIKATTLKVFENDSMDIRIKYVQYADDFLLSISGPKTVAISIREEIKTFLEEKLKLQLNLEKTHIRHAKTEDAFFLGVKLQCGSDFPRILTFERKGKERKER